MKSADQLPFDYSKFDTFRSGIQVWLNEDEINMNSKQNKETENHQDQRDLDDNTKSQSYARKQRANPESTE